MHLLDSLHRYFISLHFDHIIPIFQVKKKLAKTTNFPKVTQLLAGRVETQTQVCMVLKLIVFSARSHCQNQLFLKICINIYIFLLREVKVSSGSTVNWVPGHSGSIPDSATNFIHWSISSCTHPPTYPSIYLPSINQFIYPFTHSSNITWAFTAF